MYTFYHRRWPQRDPEQYSWYIISVLCILWLNALAVVFNLYSQLDLITKYPKIALIIVALAVMAVFYIQFLYKNKYIAFCQTGFFNNTFFKNRRLANVLLWLFILGPFLLILITIVKE